MIFLITLYIPLFFKLDKTYSCFIDFSASKDFQSEYPILLFLFIYFMWWVCCKISVCFSRSTVYAFLFTLYSGRLTYLNSANRTLEFPASSQIWPMGSASRRSEFITLVFSLLLNAELLCTARDNGREGRGEEEALCTALCLQAYFFSLHPHLYLRSN